MAQDHQMLWMFSFDIELRKVLHEEPHCGSLGGHGKSQGHDEAARKLSKIHKDMTKSVQKGHLTHNIQCDIQAQILDNLILTVSALIPRFSASMSSPDAELLKGVRWHSTIHLQNAAGHIKNATPGETCQLLSVRCT